MNSCNFCSKNLPVTSLRGRAWIDIPSTTPTIIDSLSGFIQFFVEGLLLVVMYFRVFFPRKVSDNSSIPEIFHAAVLVSSGPCVYHDPSLVLVVSECQEAVSGSLLQIQEKLVTTIGVG